MVNLRKTHTPAEHEQSIIEPVWAVDSRADHPTTGQTIRLRVYENRPATRPSRTLSIAATLWNMVDA